MTCRTTTKMATRIESAINCKETGLTIIGQKPLVSTTTSTTFQGTNRKARCSEGWKTNFAHTWCDRADVLCYYLSTTLSARRWLIYRVNIMAVAIGLVETLRRASQPKRTVLVLLSCAVGIQYQAKIFGYGAFSLDAQMFTCPNTSEQNMHVEHAHNASMHECSYSAFSNRLETEVAAKMFQYCRQIRLHRDLEVPCGIDSWYRWSRRVNEKPEPRYNYAKIVIHLRGPC